jgi:hypothetical protein
MHVEIFGVVDVFVGAGLDAVYDSGFEVEEDGAGDVACVVGLVEEDIFAVAAFGCEVFEVSVLIYAVFAAELLPEFTPDCMRISMRCRLLDACGF